MLVALISYILLKIFLARAKAQSGTEVDESHKAEIVAKVKRIVDIIDYVIVIWFKVLFGLAIILAILLSIAIIGIAIEHSALLQLEIFEFGTLAFLIEKFGVATIVSTLAIAIIPLIGIPYLLLVIFSKRQEKKVQS
jgi:hypothetical protein